MMKNNEQLVAELKQKTAGLLMMSESDYPFEIVQWNDAADLSAESLRRRVGAASDAPISEQSVDEFFHAALSARADQPIEAQRTARQYQALVQFLKENLQDLKVYRIGERAIHIYLIGRTAAGDFVGLSTQLIET